MKWMDAAWAELGQREVTGPGTNDHIKAFFAGVGRDDVTSDEVAWCAAFGGSTLVRGGIDISAIPLSQRLLANSYLKIGTPLAADQLRVGAICVLTRGQDVSQGHYGYVTAWTDTHVQLISGNAKDRVGQDWWPRARIRGLRWPEAVTVKDLRKSGSRIASGAGAIKRDTAKEAVLEWSKHAMEAMPAPGPADFASAETLAASFGQWAAHKWPVLALALQAYLLARILYHSGLIEWWRAQDASTGKTAGVGG